MSDDSSVRCRVSRDLMNEELSKENCSLLCGLLEDDDKSVRAAAASTLKYNKSSFVSYELVPFISSSNITVRNLAGEVLAARGETAVDALLDYLRQINDKDDIKFIIDLLGLIGNSKAGSDILDVLKTSEDENIILACIEAIGNIKYIDAAAYLTYIFGINSIYEPLIIEALCRLEFPGVLNFIISKYTQADVLTKFAIIEGLGKIGNDETLKLLIHELYNVEDYFIPAVINSINLLRENKQFYIPADPKLKASIQYLFSKGDTSEIIPAVSLAVNIFKNDFIDEYLRIYGNSYELDELLKPVIINNLKSAVKKAVELILTKPKNLKSLLNLIDDVWSGESGGMRFLSHLEFPFLIEALNKCLYDHDEEVRRYAADLLFKVDTEAALMFVDKMADDTNLWNKMNLLDHLENIGNNDVDEILKKLVNDPDEMIKEKAKDIILNRTETTFSNNLK